MAGVACGPIRRTREEENLLPSYIFMAYKSKYFSEKVSTPAGWTPDEFWWTVEQLEKFGNEYNLFDLAWDLGIKFDSELRGKIKIVDLMIVIINEGGSKEKIVEAIKDFIK